MDVGFERGVAVLSSRHCSSGSCCLLFSNDVALVAVYSYAEQPLATYSLPSTISFHSLLFYTYHIYCDNKTLTWRYLFCFNSDNPHFCFNFPTPPFQFDYPFKRPSPPLPSTPNTTKIENIKYFVTFSVYFFNHCCGGLFQVSHAQRHPMPVGGMLLGEKAGERLALFLQHDTPQPPHGACLWQA